MLFDDGGNRWNVVCSRIAAVAVLVTVGLLIVVRFA